ncbi:unnamed protein product [Diabrotica balteata]|uniref:Uncharacterized protein n=1 Tax=Diabrotica balteata TaxID=107213 RepID=A0A9N9X7X4_DIABA|nr:unnamed protein product [Diabrotica balteata]
MIIAKTWYKLLKRRLYTWKAPFDDGSNPKSSRNQIDYILVNERFRNAVKKSHILGQILDLIINHL